MPINFSQPVQIPGQPPVSLGAVVYAAINNPTADVKLNLAQSVALGTFANDAARGGEHEVVEPKLLTQFCMKLLPSMGVTVVGLLGLTGTLQDLLAPKDI